MDVCQEAGPSEWGTPGEGQSSGDILHDDGNNTDEEATFIPEPQPEAGGDALQPLDDEFLGEGAPLPEAELGGSEEDFEAE